MFGAACVLALAHASGCALAQDLVLGIHGGIDVPSTSIETRLRREDSPSETTSFSGGVSLEARIMGGPLSLRVGAYYVRRETKLRFADPINNLPPFDADYKLVFLDCPLELKATFAARAVGPYVFVGPSAGFRLSAKSQNTSGSASQEFDVSDQFKKANFSIDGGGGLGFAAGERVTISAEVRYSYGLTNLAGSGESWKTRDVWALAGVGFGF